MQTFGVVLLSAFVVFATAEVEKGVCPKYTTINPFDVAAYLGRWYEVERYKVFFEVGSDCVYADYGPLTSRTITVRNTGTTDSGLNQVYGIARTTDVPGSLLLKFIGAPVGHYNVLYTDYESYSCIYSCIQVGDYMEQAAWVLSRTQELDADKLAEAESVFTNLGVDLNKFRKTGQGKDCSYLPENN